VQVGGAVGLAVLATLATARTDGLLATGESGASALNSGYHVAYLVGAVLAVGAFAVALFVLRSDRARQAEEENDAVPVAREPAYLEAA
jgi:hypothetical protein